MNKFSKDLRNFKVIKILIWVAVMGIAGCSKPITRDRVKVAQVGYKNKNIVKINGKLVNLYTEEQDSGVAYGETIPDLALVTEPIPKYEPKSRYGNPNKYTIFNKTYKVLPSRKGYKEQGFASWYGKKFHGFRTSSGEIYDMYAMTAAHRTLPLPTYAKVTNLQNNASIIVKINDRGPFHHNRIIDLSYAAASRLGILDLGTAKVEVMAIDPLKPKIQDLQDLQPNLPKVPTIPAPNHLPAPMFSHTVQVGAFAFLANAEKLAMQLKETLKKHKLAGPQIANCKIDILEHYLQKAPKKNMLYKVVVRTSNKDLNFAKLKQILVHEGYAIK